jgi:serine/threonine protein kinase
MGKQTAEEMSETLVGRTIGGWLIERLINSGKPAAVFLARRADQEAALKLFDPGIIQKYGGYDAQLERIEREASLVGRSHPNLVRIYGGGEDQGFLFVAMEYFPGPHLGEALRQIPASEVRPLISQIASAARFLEGSSFAHRDIKPENIAVLLTFQGGDACQAGPRLRVTANSCLSIDFMIT